MVACFCLFFFKQKTAYEITVRDWSSDVCSSDLAAWGNGNAIVTYGDFRLAQKGAFVSAKIYDSVTHNGGQTWSTPRLISGNLDEAFVSTPVVAADGRIYVSFLNTTDLTTGRDDYEVVEVSPSTGAALS